MTTPPEKRRGLGRGLSALMADVSPVDEPSQSSPVASSDRLVPVEKIHPNPEQPRQTFTEDALEDLAASLREHGVLQPLIVRVHPSKDGEFEIVAGERRWRAAQRAGIHDLPVVIRSFSDTEVLEVAIIENVQRSDLNPIEEAAGYRMLMDRFGHTQDQVSKALGKSRSHIANLLRLLNLPEALQKHVRSGDLSMGHARALLSAKDPSSLAAEVIRKGLSVRETEKRAKTSSEGSPVSKSSSKTAPAKDADTKALEGELSAHLKMPVSIAHRPGSEGGTVTLTYRDFEQLDDLCRLLSGS